MFKGPRGEITTRNELEKYKHAQYTSYAELIEAEYPNAEQEESERKQRIINEYARRSTSRKNDFRSPDYRLLQGKALIYTLQDIEEYHELISTIQNNNTEQINELIQLLRRKLFETALFKKDIIHTPQTTSEYDNAWQELVEFDEKANTLFPNEIAVPSYQHSSPKKVEKLYHFAPAHYAKLIEEQGLVPGFITGANKKFAIYTALERNEYWIKNLQYSRNGEMPDAFIEIEIDYDDQEMNSYMWMQYYSKPKRASDDYFTLDSDVNGTLISSHLIPLNQQVQELINAAQTVGKENISDPTHYSSLLDMEIPYYNPASPARFRTSEVLLDYVPPQNIQILREVPVK